MLFITHSLHQETLLESSKWHKEAVALCAPTYSSSVPAWKQVSFLERYNKNDYCFSLSAALACHCPKWTERYSFHSRGPCRVEQVQGTPMEKYIYNACVHFTWWLFPYSVLLGQWYHVPFVFLQSDTVSFANWSSVAVSYFHLQNVC